MNSVSELPLPLLLLIHLQILQYPHVNNEDFDIYIFDAHRHGLRARTTMMENLGYWLVVKIEGHKKVKKILPTYPCIKPLETTAFRTSFAKYLEGLRQSSIKENTAAAVWWREVQARKSYLEECSEGKFLRLLLALSTHVFFTLQSVSNVEPNPELNYSTRLAFVQASQRQWVKVASGLLGREQRLMDMKARILVSTTLNSRYHSTSTPRLIALRDSKLEDILSQENWKGDSARNALKFLVTLAGLGFDVLEAGDHRSSDALSVWTQDLSPQPHWQIVHQLLPVAAARHPSYIRKLQKPIFRLAETEFAQTLQSELKSTYHYEESHEMTKKMTQLSSSSFNNAVLTLRNYRETEGYASAALERALKSVVIEARGLEERSNEMRTRSSSKPARPPQKRTTDGTLARGISFWEDKHVITNAEGRWLF
ncbi:hypothetical protein DFJ43DRAFT_1154441 [Lentinula guzmanii]|uniref:HAUS augmin-like complex subunit 6 N-terminal domain-containing protein n=2 Tax=Lentinula TaxID=5352 RepID=A0AA38MZY2_9AGAR|nr:hypothetical protein DFJ43DRAFT_1154441 [Lentinula guzmanii]KAJ3780967.1 hypothetical protein GGU10DRAFT_437589 [Lentinula aff. detonsa]KAJ3793997.1 hypothetical protein GGU11DRAFT_811555 [Lentinula aff. detonsa]